MKLYIDTTARDKIVVGLDDKKYITQSIKEKSQRLLPFINEVLVKIGKDFSSIKAIEFKEGPGSFTGLRVGLAVAYAIAWNYKIPINGKKIWKGELIKLKYD